ncbi:MAG TPA: hypothetical protein VMD91_00825 [Candidatus Sulfotelmatobacter sp.]|nr:hypothetical protein [Candidatus Sulfotelmatobacter sp.]
MDRLTADLRGWTPVHLAIRSGPPTITWARLGGPPRQPFFELDADRAMRRPFNAVFAVRTPLDVLDALVDDAAAHLPAGFVFHQSRAGSTLIARMLMQLDGAVVLSEAQPLDALLHLRRHVPDAVTPRRLHAMLHALARPAGERARTFVKWGAWHALELPVLRAVFPAVPWVFAFREPRALLESQARQLGPEAVPGTIDPRLLGITDPAELAGEDYVPRFLAALAESALREDAEPGAFVDYAELPEAVFAQVLPRFGITPTAGETAAMRAVTSRDAKQPSVAFAPRALDADPERDAWARRWLDPLYVRLRTRGAAAR